MTSQLLSLCLVAAVGEESIERAVRIDGDVPALSAVRAAVGTNVSRFVAGRAVFRSEFTELPVSDQRTVRARGTIWWDGGGTRVRVEADIERFNDEPAWGTAQTDRRVIVATPRRALRYSPEFGECGRLPAPPPPADRTARLAGSMVLPRPAGREGPDEGRSTAASTLPLPQPAVNQGRSERRRGHDDETLRHGRAAGDRLLVRRRRERRVLPGGAVRRSVGESSLTLRLRRVRMGRTRPGLVPPAQLFDAGRAEPRARSVRGPVVRAARRRI